MALFSDHATALQTEASLSTSELLANSYGATSGQSTGSINLMTQALLEWEGGRSAERVASSVPSESAAGAEPSATSTHSSSSQPNPNWIVTASPLPTSTTNTTSPTNTSPHAQQHGLVPNSVTPAPNLDYTTPTTLVPEQSARFQAPYRSASDPVTLPSQGFFAHTTGEETNLGGPNVSIVRVSTPTEPLVSAPLAQTSRQEVPANEMLPPSSAPQKSSRKPGSKPSKRVKPIPNAFTIPEMPTPNSSLVVPPPLAPADSSATLHEAMLESKPKQKADLHDVIHPSNVNLAFGPLPTDAIATSADSMSQPFQTTPIQAGNQLNFHSYHFPPNVDSRHASYRDRGPQQSEVSLFSETSTAPENLSSTGLQPEYERGSNATTPPHPLDPSFHHMLISNHDQHSSSLQENSSAAMYAHHQDLPKPSPIVATLPTATGRKRQRTQAHTPRPSNSFILYRREKHGEILAQYSGAKALNNNVISKIVATMWKNEDPQVKAHYAMMAEEEKKAHMLKYPDYKYRPRKGANKANAGAISSSNSVIGKNSATSRSNSIDAGQPISSDISQDYQAGSGFIDGINSQENVDALAFNSTAAQDYYTRSSVVQNPHMSQMYMQSQHPSLHHGFHSGFPTNDESWSVTASNYATQQLKQHQPQQQHHQLMSRGPHSHDQQQFMTNAYEAYAAAHHHLMAGGGASSIGGHLENMYSYQNAPQHHMDGYSGINDYQYRTRTAGDIGGEEVFGGFVLGGNDGISGEGDNVGHDHGIADLGRNFEITSHH